MEDTEAEDVERVRARKEGGDRWNRDQPKHYVRTYSIDKEHQEGDTIREGFEPNEVPAATITSEHAVSDDDDDDDQEGDITPNTSGRYGSLVEESNVWG